MEDMRKVAFVAEAALSAICFIVGGILAFNGVSGWGWFLLVGALNAPCLRWSSRDKKKPE